MTKIAAALLFFIAGVCGGAELRVAVLDMQVAGSITNGWEWAPRGVADLLQIELQHHGVELVDRDLIRAVLREQRLGPANLTDVDERQLGRVIGARFLVSGRLQLQAGGQIYFEATATAVQEVETIATASAAGAYPADLLKIIGAVAGQLARQLGAAPPPVSGATARHPLPSPEVLMRFYQGVEMCAQGWPELGLGSFISATQLDPKFTAAKTWQYKAYRLAGFEDHADLVAKELSALPGESMAAVVLAGRSETLKGKRVLAVTEPLLPVTPEDAGLAEFNRTQVRAALERAVLRNGRVRLFNAQMLREVAAEFDLQLSGAIRESSAPLLDRWLMADGVLFCRAEAVAGGRLAIHLEICDPVTAARLFRRDAVGARSEITELAERLAAEMLTDWGAQSFVRRGGALTEVASPRDYPHKKLDQFEVAARLAHGLSDVRQGREERAAGMDLVWLYNSQLGQPAHALLEKHRLWESLRWDEPHAAYWHDRFDSLPVLRGETHAPDMSAVTPPWHDNPAEILTRAPDSLAAGCVGYRAGQQAWRAGQFAEALPRLQRAALVLDRWPRHPKMHSPSIQDGLVKGCHVMIADILLRTGHDAEAQTALEQAGPPPDSREPRRYPLPAQPQLGLWNDHEIVWGAGLGTVDLPGPSVNAENPDQVFDRYTEWKKTRTLSLRKDNPDIAEAVVRLAACRHALMGRWQRQPRLPTDSLSGWNPGGVDLVVQPLLDLRFFETHTQSDLGSGAATKELALAYRAWVGMDALMGDPKTAPDKVVAAAARLAEIYAAGGLSTQAENQFDELWSTRFSTNIAMIALHKFGIVSTNAAAYEQRLRLVAARLPGQDADLPPVIWFQWGLKCQAARQFAQAEHCYQQTIVFTAAGRSRCLGTGSLLWPNGMTSAPASAVRCSAALHRAECLVNLQRPEAAATQLREIILETTGQDLSLTDANGNSHGDRLDQLAAKLLATIRTAATKSRP